MTARLHHTALMVRLKSTGGIDDAYDGKVPKDLQRWAKVYPPANWRSQTRFAGLRTTQNFTWTVHSVGLSVDEAMWVQERVGLKLDDALLTVPGWNPRRLNHVVSRPMNIDESGPVPLHYVVDQFDLISDPA